MLCLLSVSTFSASAADLKGMITTRTGETLIVKSAQGNAVTVVLTDDTKIKDDTGLFGLGTDKMASVVLIPGLKVSIDGTPDDKGAIIAKTITVDGDDLETSEMIQAGLHPTAQQVAANMAAIEANKQGIGTNAQAIGANKQGVSSNSARIAELERQARQNTASHQTKIAPTIKEVEDTTNRFTALADYQVKGQATVKFGVGSSSITAEDEEALKTLAETAIGLRGYIIEVTGHADSTGNDAMNTKLSEDRAKSVITYLMQKGGVPVRHIVAPGAMGEYGPAASNETDAGRAENRRVEIKVLVNKGITGG
jgi:outer membrane protein OmpA-like peptidoglycan-associated protein